MKKLFFYAALFAAGFAVTSCSSDKDVVVDNSTIENGGGNYIAISINLPNVPTSVTRATTDNGGNVVDLNDGLASEYEVKDATLIIFNNSGNFVEARTIDTKPWTSSTDDHVTRVSTKVVQKVGGSVATGYQMLIILNNNGLINVPTGTTTLQVMKNGTLTAFTGNYSDLFTESNKYFATTTGLNCGTMNTNGFYMANAPLADKQGSTATTIDGAAVQVLVPITTVYETEAAAAAGTADQIYVERGMAKVTMEEAITTPTLSNSKIDGSTALVGEVTGWTIDNTNPSSFLVRSTDGHDSFLPLISNSTAPGAAVYRYIGNTAITEGSPATYKYRTYFAKSANYDKSTNLNRVTSSTVFSHDFGDTNPQYCFENTFSVEDQDVNKTTLVQVAIQAKAGGVTADLYTVNGNKSSIYNLTSLTTLIQSKALEYIKAQTGWVTSGTIASTEITVGEITVNADNKVTAIALTCTPSATVDATKFYKDGTGTNKTLPDAVYTHVLSETGDILKYVSGISYYNIRIKHFGDLLTPWKNLETAQPTTGNIYPGANANNYLGRYGVLRNNWYNLKVNSIRSLGEATPHTATWTDTPDDELDNYISFQINILSWAKHETQNADL